MKLSGLKRITVLIDVMILAVFLCACSSTRNSISGSEEFQSDEVYPTVAASAQEAAFAVNSITENDLYEETTAAAAESSYNEELQNSEEHKLIRNINISLETENLEPVTENIRKNIEAAGGYIQYSNEYLGGSYSNSNRYASVTARIPADRTDEFLDKGFSDAYVTSFSENTEDISLTYSDLETRKKTLTTERDRILELLEDATNIDAIITLENYLSDIRYELESIQSSLKNYDNRVTYSTVCINITEVERHEAVAEASFGERVKSGFLNSTDKLFDILKDIAVWLLSNILSIILLSGLAVGIISAIQKIKKYNKRESNKNEQTRITEKDENAEEGTNSNR